MLELYIYYGLIFKRGGVDEASTTVSTILQSVGNSLGTVQTDVFNALSTIVPIAITVAGAVWIFRRVFRWFASTAGR